MKKFQAAINGLKISFSDKSIKIQWFLGVITLVFAGILRLKLNDLVYIIFLIGLIISLEIINSVIERICDLYTKEYNIDVKIIKDLSASFVFIMSMVAMIIGILIFSKYI